ncbi:MAG TPA: hypothetical protein VMQ60_01935, partial [Acidobacteriaceae bacterium]|nr:hypothetical protein [Acidobacteriaceae bacterium]
MRRRLHNLNTAPLNKLASSMRTGIAFPGMALVLLFFLTASRLGAQAGPPFQTDDPTPVDLGHYEFYVFSTFDGTPAEADPTGPASLS